MKQLLKTLCTLCICMGLVTLSFAKGKSILVTTSKSGNSLYKVYSPVTKKYSYNAKDKNGRTIGCGPIKPGSKTPIPTNCEILCDKDFHGNDVCYLVCPSTPK